MSALRPLAVVLALAAACRAVQPPPPLAPPPLALAARTYGGTPLGADADGVPADELDLERALVARCRVVYLERMPEAALASLASRTRLIGATRGAVPVLSSALAAGGARAGAGEDARAFARRLEGGELGRSAELGRLAAALPGAPTGVTALFEAESQHELERPDLGPVRVRVAMHVAAPPAAADGERELEAVLVVEDLVPVDGGADAAGTARVLAREMIALTDRPAPGEPLALVLPSPFGTDPGAPPGGFAVLLDVAPATDADEGLLATAAGDLAPRAPGAPDPLAARRESLAALGAGLAALDEAHTHRQGLVFLSGELGAPLALDLALTGSEEELAAWIQTLPRDDRDALDGWALEASAWTFLCVLAIERPPLPDALTGLLAAHAGEVSGSPGLLRDLVGASASRADLEQRLVAENGILLEDADPAARLRACAWLAERGLAPDGFDPLADKDERRAALARAREEAQP